MNFDATVTLQTLIYAALALAGFLTFAIGAVGSRLFASKSDVGELKTVIEKASYDSRSSMQIEINRIEARAGERHDQYCRDMERIEHTTEAIRDDVKRMSEGVNAAVRDAEVARNSADRSERLVDGLMQRRRERDT